MNKKPKTVDEYINNAPKETQAKLRELRDIICTTASKAEEKISYSMPHYVYNGRLAYFAYAKSHVGLYVMPPVIKQHKELLKDYETAMATVRFPLEKKLPVTLIKKLIKAGMKNNDAKTKKKK